MRWKLSVNMPSVTQSAVRFRFPFRLRTFRHAFWVLVVFIFFNSLWGQEQSAIDSLPEPTLTGALIRSALVPGWGQIYQERLVQGAVLYSAAAVYYYRTIFHWYHYQKTGSQNHLNLLRANASASLFIYLLNLIDVTDAGLHGEAHGWHGGLLDDRPLKSPWGAALRSAALPGWGQIYVETYWKAAGYFLLDAYLGYQIAVNDRKYRDTREVKYREERSRFSWYFGLAYLITVADAYAGAYLYKFDQAMQMTLTIEPKQFLGVRFYVPF